MPKSALFWIEPARGAGSWLLVWGLCACSSVPEPEAHDTQTGGTGTVDGRVTSIGSVGSGTTASGALTSGTTTGSTLTSGAGATVGSGGTAPAVTTTASMTTGSVTSSGMPTATATHGNTTSGSTTASGSGGASANGGTPATTSNTATSGAGGALTPVGRHGQLKVVGNQLSNASGAPVVLRGQGFGWDNWWPQYYNANVVAWLRQDWCVDIVRPAMGIEPAGAYLENSSASRSRIQAVVDAAIAEEIYVIVDWHAHELHLNEAIAFFTDMAQTYGSYPNVIYEVFNEPEEQTWAEVKAYAEAVIGAIRQHDPDNIVIVGSPEWDQRIDLVAADPITSDANVVYSVHFYAAAHGQWLRDRTAAALAAGVPVLVSESSGSEASGQGANDYAEWEAWFDLMETNHISWVHYSVSDKAGETISVLEPGASANGGWGADELTETGEYIRELLRRHCDG